MLLKIIIVYLIIINGIGYILIGLDKGKAKRNKWRIKESTLLKAAAAGGSLGVWIGMSNYHHKTRDPKFSKGVPAIFILQILVIILIFILINK